jgi:hypothetical protein
LHGDQLGGRVVPSLWAAAPVRGAAVTDGGRGFVSLMARAPEGLTFSVADRLVSLGFSASWHDLTSVT